MYRVCTEKATGNLIEMQSGGDDRQGLMDARLETLRKNAMAAGYPEDGIEVKWISKAEWELIREADRNRRRDPEKEQAEALIKEKIRELAVAALKAEGRLTADGKVPQSG